MNTDVYRASVLPICIYLRSFAEDCFNWQYQSCIRSSEV